MKDLITQVRENVREVEELRQFKKNVQNYLKKSSEFWSDDSQSADQKSQAFANRKTQQKLDLGELIISNYLPADYSDEAYNELYSGILEILNPYIFSEALGAADEEQNA